VEKDLDRREKERKRHCQKIQIKRNIPNK